MHLKVYLGEEKAYEDIDENQIPKELKSLIGKV